MFNNGCLKFNALLCSLVVGGTALLSGCGGGNSGSHRGGASPTPTPATTPTIATPRPPSGEIVFRSNQSGTYNLYLVNGDGTDQRRLTTDAAGDSDPVLSPDGSKVAFASFRDEGHGEIYVMNRDGSGLVRITNNTALDDEPTWSPDGKSLAFSSFRDGNREIYRVNATGGAQTNLTRSVTSDSHPDWSPTGNRIAFDSTAPTTNNEIYVMNTDGSGATNLTNNPASDTDPAWSPDGSHIAFASNREPTDAAQVNVKIVGRSTALFRMNPDGSNVVNLTPSLTGSIGSLTQDSQPTYSPDGSKIAFTRTPRGLYAVSANGGAGTPLPNDAAARGDQSDWR